MLYGIDFLDLYMMVYIIEIVFLVDVQIGLVMVWVEIDNLFCDFDLLGMVVWGLVYFLVGCGIFVLWIVLVVLKDDYVVWVVDEQGCVIFVLVKVEWFVEDVVIFVDGLCVGQIVVGVGL